MRDLAGFRDAVEQYCKRVGRTQKDLAAALYLTEGDLNKRLRDYSHQPSRRTWRLKPEHVLKIVETLAKWGAITARKQAFALFTLIDFPVLAEEIDWQTSPWNKLHIDTSPTEPSPSLSVHVRRRLFQARDLPKEYVPRPNAFDEIKRLLLTQEETQTTAITTALRGAGGFGKTTLATALCHDAEIQAAFPDILWIELGDQPPQALDLLNRLLTLYEASSSEAITLQEAQERWHLALRDRVCLLVIDDVWQQEALSPLLQGGARCRHLVTTRNDVLLPKHAARVVVDAMTLPEAVQVLCQDEALPVELAHPGYRSQLEALADRLGCWPLLLTLARGMLTDLVAEYHLSISEALTTIVEAYETRGVTAFRLDNADERQQTVHACLRVSLQQLEKKFTHPHYHATERYQELAVFPEDTDIPLATLQIYWKGSAGLEPWETKDLCIRLHRLSLLLTCNLGTGTVRLHDVLRNYLLQRVGAGLPALHGRLLDACQQEYGLTRWADLPRSEAYLWQHLILHLRQAGHQEMLQVTLTDLMYLTHKALYVGVSGLESDTLLASMLPPTETTELALSFFATLHRSIVRVSHLLRQAQTEAEMGGLLLSYLGWETAFAPQQSLFEKRLSRPYLQARHPLPERSSSTLLRTFLGHTDKVYGCAVSPDGSFIVSASEDCTLKVWDAATGMVLYTLSGHTNAVRSCAVSPDSNFIVSTSEDCTLKVWDTTTKAVIHTLSGHSGSVYGCAVSPDGSFIVSASEDCTLKVWDAATGMVLHTLSGHTNAVRSCAVSPDGSFIVSASEDCTLKIWDTTTKAVIHTLSGHTAEVTSCAVSSDGGFILSAANNGMLKMWDSSTGIQCFSLYIHTGSILGCAMSPDGRYLLSTSTWVLNVWDRSTGAPRFFLSGHTGWVCGCAVSPDGRYLLSTSFDGTLKTWDISTEEQQRIRSVHTGAVFDCAVSPNGRFILSASADHTLKVWDAATGVVQRTLSGHTSVVFGCAVSPNSKFIVSASEDHTLKVWNAIFEAEPLTLIGHSRRVLRCAVSPDSSFIVSASEDCTLKVWDAATGVVRRTLSDHTSGVVGCAVSPDGQRIVSASDDKTLKVWNATFEAEPLTLIGHSHGVSSCAVSSDSRWITSTSGDRTLKVWDMRTGRCRLTFPTDGELAKCIFHSDGQHLVACGTNGVYFLKLVV